MKRPTSMGIYGGIGSGLLGLKWAGVKPIFNHEPRDFFNEETWNFNFRGVGYSRRLRPVDLKPDFMIGNPSCNVFSVSANAARYEINESTIKDTDLYKSFRIIELYQPTYFIIENVPNVRHMLTLADDHFFFKFLPERKILKGYKITITKLNSIDFGVPQSRRRIFIVGCLDKKAPPVKLTKSRDVGDHYVGFSVYDAFEDIHPGLPNMQLPYHADHRRKKMAELKAEESYYNAQGNKRLNIRKPSHVVTSSASRAIHPFENRVITVRETARLMGYPDDFVFFGGLLNKLDQVGKAVVPQVVYSIGLDIKEHSKKYDTL